MECTEKWVHADRYSQSSVPHFQHITILLREEWSWRKRNRAELYDTRSVMDNEEKACEKKKVRKGS